MALTDVFVSWFPMLFGGSFLLSILVFEARERGHLRFGREPGKGALVGLLLILGFNFVVFIPVMLIMFIASLIGFTSPIEAILTALMALYYIIPSILSGVVTYGIVKGVFEGWGIGLTGFLFSGVLFLLVLLDGLGILEPAMPWIADAAIHFISFGFGSILVWVVFGVCLSKIVSTPTKDSDKPDEETTTRKSISQDSTLNLVARLGRRVATDGSEEAMQTLRNLIERGPPVQSMLLAAGNTMNVNLRDALARNDVRYAQQQLEPLTKRFGRFSKRVRDAFTVLSAVSIISGIVTAWSLYNRIPLGIAFMFPAIMIPVLMAIGAQEISSLRQGKYFPPSVNLYNSYLLTDREFSKKSRSDTARVAVSLALLLAILTDALARTPLNIIWIASATAGLLFVAALSSRDRSLHLIRVNQETMERRALEYLGIDPDVPYESTGLESTPDIWASESTSEVRPGRPRREDEWKQELEIHGHADFAQRVEKGSREAYTEHQASYCFMGGGGIMVLVAVLTWFAFSSFEFLGGMFFFSLALGVIGTPVLLYGLVQYVRALPTSKFYGLNRKHLTGLLSILDLEATGVDEVGNIYDRTAPSEYQTIGMSVLFRKMFIRTAITKLPSHIPWKAEDVVSVKETRAGFPKLESIALVGSLAVTAILYIFLIPVDIPYMPFFFRLIFVGLAAFMALTAVYSIVSFYREKRALSEIAQPSDATDSVDTLNALFDLIRAEFRRPLRLLLVGEYRQVEYTGKTYFTSTGVELREAVLVPS